MATAMSSASIRRSTATPAASRAFLSPFPIEVATHVQDEILKTGKVEHARLGVTIQPVNQSLAKSFHLECPAGALVSKVEPGSAAEHAGCRPAM